MNKILLITQREFTSRVRKKSFIIMSILAPLIFGGFVSLMAYFASSGDMEVKNIAVLDSSTVFFNKIPDNKSLHFVYLNNIQLSELKSNLKKSNFYGILYIHPAILEGSKVAKFYSFSQPGISVVDHISKSLEKELRNKKLEEEDLKHIDQILKKIETESSISLQTIKLGEKGGEKSGSTEMAMIIAYISSLLIYMFILLYGVQVMRGVIEEKTNRIVEVIISSVKPFQLMMGKVLGVALTALTQFLIWVILSTAFFMVAKHVFVPDITVASVKTPSHSIMEAQKMITQDNTMAPPKVDDKVLEVFTMIESINYFKLFGLFIFYFITGYLLYSSLFAAVGSAVDNEADTQQFVLPVTLPLIAGIMIMIQAFQNPDSSIAVWGSIIPLTAPIVMMARIPFDAPTTGQLILSMSLMVLSFIGTIWLAAKIYRTGILMYGKKVTFKEMFKWLRYKN